MNQMFENKKQRSVARPYGLMLNGYTNVPWKINLAVTIVYVMFLCPLQHILPTESIAFGVATVFY